MKNEILAEDEVLVCERDNDGNLKCRIESKERCKTFKETGTGLYGPIFNVKRVCPIEKPRDVLTKW